MLTSAALFFAAYLAGSLPFAVIVSRILGLADPRAYGSGNPGATNVLRSGNRKAAILTLLGDALKGSLVVILARILAPQLGIPATAIAMAGLFAFLGHVFSIFLRFSGGKGVATAAGVLLAMSPLAGALVLAIWLLVALTTRYSSAAALAAALAAPLVTAWLVPDPGWIGAVCAMAAILLWRHTTNIKRLFSGQESRIGSRSK
ncbi:glycerol-3-phosphate 1-O-acyltransferase PlsY [Niveibacterium terrae]|uniref:glycerol-3-phosphate 1-O-acyltransferase PlsY n=1 Tax=Niveibacterium terrae TaxID=3373598 RepID=UPI003A8F2F1A